MTLKTRPGVMEIAPYVGGEASVPGIAKPAKLSSNENPLGPSPKAIAAFRDAAVEMHRYPDGGAEKLRDGIARHFGLEKACIVCGNGSDELIALLTRAYAGPGDEVLFSAHGFLMYRLSALGAGATPKAAPEKNYATDMEALLALVTPVTRIVFIGNPNNPTGSYMTAAQMRELRARLRSDILMVIDAAYAEFVEDRDYNAGEELVRAGDNVVMLRTFSKIFGLAGLRLGWAFCPPSVADVLNRIRAPFNTSMPAQAAAVAALEDREHVAKSLAHNKKWRDWLAAELRKLGYVVHPSVGNFLLVEFNDADAADRYLKSRGLILRKMGVYGLGHCLRITVGTEAETRALATAMADYANAKAKAAIVR
ncbi:MAG TPA: histidinol-phosphate transaminase [Candidatus Polarisedimenticolia bacterium]|nr:histidinol-phosphate transaminase [Candidatus Polarisedimenticolia bacterium]